MKIVNTIISSITAATFALPAFADHNSKFGDNTGRTVAGVHDNRIDSNLKSDVNSTAMGKYSTAVSSSGSLGSYAQSEAPETVLLDQWDVTGMGTVDSF